MDLRCVWLVACRFDDVLQRFFMKLFGHFNTLPFVFRLGAACSFIVFVELFYYRRSLIRDL